MNSDYKIILFYKFIDIADPEKVRDEQKTLAASFGLLGRMLVGTEGINATFEGRAQDIDAYMEAFCKQSHFCDVIFKESPGTGKSFSKLIVRVRPEIVTLGAGQFDIKNETAPQITAEEFDRLYETDEDFVVLDLRNDYEVATGKFERTVDPKLQNFRDLPQKLPELEELKNKKVVTVCTGGIRCEKATCLLKRQGFQNVYQLKDGIHTYMQKFPGKRFKGTLFVFDNRMVTPVVDVADREIIGQCTFCQNKTEDYYNDDSVRPSLKVICCQRCVTSHPELRPAA